MEYIADRVFGKENRTYLMGLSMLWIVIFHICTWSDAAGVNTFRFLKLFVDGSIGVDVFLLLSAYGLQASIEKNRISKFYLNRIKRLFPVYFFFLATLFLTYENDCPFSRMMIQTLYQITGLSLFKYQDFFSCGFCFDWFTPAIITIYLFFPLISIVVKKVISRGFSFELFFLILLIVFGVWVRENKHFPFGLLALRFPILFLGCTFFIHLKNGALNKVLSLCFISGCIGLLTGNLEMKRSLILLPLLLAFSLTRFNLPLKKIVCRVGKHSYEIYLAHIILVAFFIPSKTVSNFYLLCIITLISSMIIAGFYYYMNYIFYYFCGFVKKAINA